MEASGRIADDEQFAYLRSCKFDLFGPGKPPLVRGRFLLRALRMPAGIVPPAAGSGGDRRACGTLLKPNEATERRS